MTIVVPIAADYDASGVKKAERDFSNFGQSLSRSLQQAGQAAKKSLAAIEEGAQDSRTAAQRLAAQITTTAQTLDQQLGKSEAAATALANALGPEFVARVGKGGINRIVTDLNRAGLSMAEITADAQTLAGAIRQVDSVNLAHVTTEADMLGQKMAQANTQVTASRQVFSSFAGQATTELANIGGPLGAVASGVGQIVAQSAAGKVSLLDFAKVAGPLAGVSLVLLQVKSVFADISKTKAFNKENVDAFQKSLLDGASAAGALRDRLAEVGKLELRAFDPEAFAGLSGFSQKIPGIVDTITGGVSKIFGLFARSGTADLTQEAIKLGLTTDRVGKLIAGGASKINEWAAAQKAAGAETGSLDKITRALLQRLDELNTATENTTVTERFLLDTTRQSTSATMALAAANGAAATAIDVKTKADEAAAVAAEAAAKADQAQANGIDAVRESLYKRNNASYAATDADQNARDALDAYNKAQAKADRTGRAKDIEAAADAQRAAERAVNGAAAAYDNLAGEQYKYSDETTRANAQTRAAREELERLGLTIKPGSELYRTVQDWIFILGQIPKDVITRFGISFGSSVTTAKPSSGSSMTDTIGGNWSLPAGTSNATTTSVTNNITVNGAVDRVGTARTISEVLTKDQQRQGLPE